MSAICPEPMEQGDRVTGFERAGAVDWKVTLGTTGHVR